MLWAKRAAIFWAGLQEGGKFSWRGSTSPLTWPYRELRVATQRRWRTRWRLRWAKGEPGSLRSIPSHQGTVTRSHSQPQRHPFLTCGSLLYPLQLLYDGKYCPSCLCLSVFSQRTRDVLPLVCLWHSMVSRAAVIYRDCDESTKPQAAAVFTLLVSKFGEFDRKAVECVFIWEEARRDWLCLLSDCCLCVSSTTNRDSLLFIWTPAQTSDLSKWVANPSPSYCGARAGVPAMLPPSGPKGRLHQVYKERNDYRSWGALLHIWIKLHEAFFSWAAQSQINRIKWRVKRKKKSLHHLCICSWSEVSSSRLH